MARTRYRQREGWRRANSPIEQAIRIADPIYEREGAYYRINGVMRTTDEYLDLIYACYQDTFDATKEDVLRRAAERVPVRTGQLLDSVIRCINTRWSIDNDNVHLEIGSDVKYAYDLVGEPAHGATWFEHDGRWAYAYYYGHSGKIYLNDPNAVIDWQNDLFDYMMATWDNYMLSYQQYYGVA